MNNINDLQEQFENLIKQGQELLEKMKENHIGETNEKVRRKPTNMEAYAYIDSVGKAKLTYWTDKDDDLSRFTLGNVFKTLQEAQKDLDRRIAEHELLNMCDWAGEEKAYVIDYDVKTNSFDWNWFYEIVTPYRFSSEESVKKAIDTLGTKKLKLIFRID